jgi:hypothetical protein
LESFSGNVKWEIIGINDTFYEGEPFWDEVFTVIHDKNSSDIQLKIILLLLVLKKIKWSSFWHKQKSCKFQLALN